jgi:hypothetical protein
MENLRNFVIGDIEKGLLKSGVSEESIQKAKDKHEKEKELEAVAESIGEERIMGLMVRVIRDGKTIMRTRDDISPDELRVIDHLCEELIDGFIED